MTVTDEPVSNAAVRSSAYRPGYGVAVFTGSQIIALAFSFVGGALMVRTATPANVASYLLLLQAIMALTLLLQLGLAPATLRFAPLARGLGGGATTSRLRSRLLGLLIATWALLSGPILLYWPTLATRLDAPELGAAGIPILAAASLLAFNQVMDAYVRSFRRYGTSALAGDILPRLVSSFGFVCLFLLGGQVHWTFLALIFLAGHLASGAAFGIALYTTTSGEASEPRAASPTPALSNLLATAITMGLRAGTAVLMAASAAWVLSWARPHEEVAVFGMMVSLLQVVSVIPSGVARVVTQEFATLHADGRRAELEHLVRSCATVTALVSLGVLLVLAAAGRPLIRLAYGEGYVSGWIILMILATGTLVDSGFGFAGYLLQMTGHHLKLFFVSLGAAAVNIFLSISLVTRFGGVGVAFANTTSLVLLNIAMVMAVRSHLQIRTVAYSDPRQWRVLISSYRADVWSLSRRWISKQ